MDIDLPKLSEFLSQPITAVEIALPTSLGGKWPWGPKVRSNFAAIRTVSGTLFFHFGAVPDSLLNGIFDDNPYEGYVTSGTLALIAEGDDAWEREALALPRPLQSPEPMEMIDLASLFPEARRIYVPDATSCEVSFSQTIRNGVFRFDVSGIRIYSSEASTLLERGSGGVLECSVTSDGR
jgi:hypothetical protein